MGSKARLSKDLAPLINKLIEDNRIETYIEPFVGGANLIDKIDCENKIGYDINEYLIAMWNALQNGYEPPEFITREEYNDVKSNMEKYSKEHVAIVGFCATYNGGWFRRYGAIANTKIGKVRNYYDEGIRNIKKQLPQVMSVDFRHGCYSDIDMKNSLIYCDPPYESSNYEMYDEGKTMNYEDYWNWVREMSKDNIVLCSEYNAPSDFRCIYEKELTTTFDNKGRKKDTEKVFVLSK